MHQKPDKKTKLEWHQTKLNPNYTFLIQHCEGGKLTTKLTLERTTQEFGTPTPF